MPSFFSSGTLIKTKKPKKKKELAIGSPTEFKHILHLTPRDILVTDERRAAQFRRSHSEGPVSLPQTLPRNTRLNASCNIGTISSPLDDVVHPVTDDEIKDSAHRYYARKVRRPQLPTEWAAQEKVNKWASQGNLIINANYMVTATGGSSDYGTMTDSMCDGRCPGQRAFRGSRRSAGSRTLINSNYVDRGTLDRYRSKSQDRQRLEEPAIKGILKTETEGRLYQQAPFNERNLPNNTIGKKIRSSTAESRSSPKAASPSPLTRPSTLPTSTIQAELSLSEVTSTPHPDTRTPLSLSDTRSVSIIFKDGRSVTAKLREVYEAPMADDDEFEQGTVIIHL